VHAYRGFETKEVHLPGDKTPGLRLWPSKDAAETAVLRTASDRSYAHGDGSSIWLGAYPEGEAP